LKEEGAERRAWCTVWVAALQVRYVALSVAIDGRRVEGFPLTDVWRSRLVANASYFRLQE